MVSGSVPAARVSLAWPRREEEQEPGVVGGAHLASLVGIELGQQPGTAADRIASRLLDLNRPRDDEQPGAFVNLVLLEALARGKLNCDRPTLFLRVEDGRVVGLHVQRRDVPAPHRLC